MPSGVFIGYLGSDARRWAKAFVELHGDKLPDEDLLIGWFANAIMVGYEQGKRR